MDDENIKVIIDELGVKSNSYKTNLFNQDVINIAQLQKTNTRIDQIIDAKNEWEICVDALEKQLLILLDNDLNIIRANRTVEKWGWGDVNEIKGKHIFNLVTPVLDAHSLEKWVSEWKRINTQENVEWESVNYKSRKKYRFSFFPIRDVDGVYHNDKCYAILVVNDITDRMISANNNVTDRRKVNLFSSQHNNELIKDTKNRLHDVANELIHSKEYERQRISSELHDGIGQVLSALKFQVESVVSESRNITTKRKNDIVLNHVLENIKTALSDIKRISIDLRPTVIDELGVILAVKLFIDEYIKIYSDINIELDCNIDESYVPEENKIVIYRIIQEALSNIAKHACANNVFVQLITHDNDTLVLRVSDNGCGFDLNEVNNVSNGLGLNTMKERAINSGGDFRINSTTFSGTTIEVIWMNS